MAPGTTPASGTKGFEETRHTADCAIRVWAPDLSTLFAEAGRGLNSVAGARIIGRERVKREITLQASDVEDLLVAFLTELVIAQEQENLAFDEFDLRIANGTLSGHMEGGPLESLTIPVKAVTYHNLGISKTGTRCEVEIVFDV